MYMSKMFRWINKMQTWIYTKEERRHIYEFFNTSVLRKEESRLCLIHKDYPWEWKTKLRFSFSPPVLDSSAVLSSWNCWTSSMKFSAVWTGQQVSYLFTLDFAKQTNNKIIHFLLKTINAITVNLHQLQTGKNKID